MPFPQTGTSGKEKSRNPTAGNTEMHQFYASRPMVSSTSVSQVYKYAQRAVERDEIPYPYKVHDTTLRPLLNITIKSTIVVRSRSKSCGGGDICGQLPHKDRM